MVLGWLLCIERPLHVFLEPARYAEMQCFLQMQSWRLDVMASRCPRARIQTPNFMTVGSYMAFQHISLRDHADWSMMDS